jgi:1,4-dihydroxy-2-naphthoyl-CoA hydrolase
MLFNKAVSPSELTVECKDTLVSNLGIEFTDISDDSITAKMPVDHRTIQPFGILHGGASLALAETLGSMASHLIVDNTRFACVGMEINGNHIRPAGPGWVSGTVTAVHIGKKSHIWEIKINNDEGKLVCISRLTMAVIENNK